MKKLIDPITKIDLDEAFEKYDRKNRGYRDQILRGLDKVAKELETMRQESTVGAYQTRELTKKVNDHEKRNTDLKSALSH